MQLLHTEPYADVAPLIRRSGVYGGFGWVGLRIVLGSRRNWGFMTGPFVRQAGRRCAETFGRRFFPNWLARLCVAIFFGRSARMPSTAGSPALQSGPASTAGH